MTLPEPGRIEQLWARQVGDDLFQVCCIPFFARDLSLGDVVRTTAQGGRDFMVSEVVEPSGHWTFRVWLRDSTEHSVSLEAGFMSSGALTEWSSEHLLALDVPDAPGAQRLADELRAGEAAGRWIYEAGKP